MQDLYSQSISGEIMEIEMNGKLTLLLDLNFSEHLCMVVLTRNTRTWELRMTNSRLA